MSAIASFGKTLIDRINTITPAWHRTVNRTVALSRRAFKKPRAVSENTNLLPLMIKVLAAFTKIDGEIQEDEVDSSLGFLRYDYPEAVYSELRRLFRQALNEQQDLSGMAQKLATDLPPDRKILLGVQLYDLISKAGLKQEQVIAYYTFMSQLGMATQAIDIVYQLNASDSSDTTIYERGASPLESLSFGPSDPADVILHDLTGDERLMAYRYHDLIILKNQATKPIVVRGRPLAPGQFCRIYPGQRIIVDEIVITQQDLVAYFNAKKNVSVPVVYVHVRAEDEVEIDRTKSRDSDLEVRFGLKVQINVLYTVDGSINNVDLKEGATLEAHLEDKIVFANGNELELLDLRRRARAMGGRFQLQAQKSEYLVSNNPALLDEDDILLSPGTGGEVLLKIFCDYDKRVGQVLVLQADRPILVGDHPIRHSANLRDGDTIRIDTGQVLRCDFSERIIEEERNIIRQLEVQDLNHRFRAGETAVDGISFSIQRGEMVCVMGASGSGKSTLMRILAGRLEPQSGQVLLNGQHFYQNLESLKNYVAYIPQDDAFDDHLTIAENLDFAAAIRSPHLSARDRERRIDAKLIELGLAERRDSIVGSSQRKLLSGGERKRLNIGLDMISNADVYLFDEPTSGLSSKDSEHVIDIIRGMAHNKIVLVTLHQPTSKIFMMFNKAMLLDKGGRLVFFGTPQEMLQYFARAEHQQQFGAELGGCPSCGTTRPEFIFDVLETPLRDLSGDIIYEENSRGQLVPARRYSPDYWRDKYESHRLFQDMRQVSVKREPAPHLPYAYRPRRFRRFGEEWTQFRTLLARAFKSKLRNRANLVITTVVSPLLALLVGFVLKYSEAENYDFASAYHIPTYLFVALIVAMFLGLTNSADDIIRDRTVLQRERNLNVHIGYYVWAKALTLALFGLIQCVLFLLIGNAILEIRGMFWWHLIWMGTTSFWGIAMGLVVSSFVNDAKTAANIVPMILIPQMILGGALIKYEEMNRNLDFVYTINRWFSQHKDNDGPHDRSKLKVPFVCQVMPLRWSYEAIVVAQEKLNPFTRRQELLNDAIRPLRQKDRKLRTRADIERLNELKDALATLSSIVARTPGAIDEQLRQIDEVIAGQRPPPGQAEGHDGKLSAEQIYVNQKIVDLVSKAETEQADYRRADRNGNRYLINVFFGPMQRRFGHDVSVFLVNAVVLHSTSVLLLIILYISLRSQLRIRRS
ncbi:MAG TPA: ATP-binding cassette domain-containing protein [Chthoniobacterales bacterium]